MFFPTHLIMTQLISTAIFSYVKSFLTTDAGAASLMICFSFRLDHRHSEGQSALGSGPYKHSIWEETAKEMGQPTPKVSIVSVLSLQPSPFLCSLDISVMRYGIQTRWIAVDQIRIVNKLYNWLLFN